MMVTSGYSSRSWSQAARHGAGAGVKMTLLYASVFILYALIRSTIELYSWPAPDAGTISTVLATAASLIIAALAISLLLLPLSALAGIGTSLLLHLLLPRNSRRFSIAGTLVISLVVAFAIADTVQLILLPAIGFQPFDLPFETWVFWFGLPTLLYVIVIGFEGGRMRSGGLLPGKVMPAGRHIPSVGGIPLKKDVR